MSANLVCDIPALTELAKGANTPLAGKEFKTGQAFESSNFTGNGACRPSQKIDVSNNLFETSKQLINLQNTLNYLKTKDLIAHLNLDCTNKYKTRPSDKFTMNT